MYSKRTTRPTETVSNTQVKQQQLNFQDRRSQFFSQRKTIQMMNTTPLLQRMVIVGMEEGEVDKVIAADIAFQHSKVGGRIIKLSDLDKAKPGEIQINEGEGVVITAHGTPGMVGIYQGTQIRALLDKITNIKMAKFIFISSCDSATGNESTQSVVDSVGEGMPSPVYGSPGIAINDYSQITGDGRTVYKKDDSEVYYETMALFIEEAITKMCIPDVKKSLKKGSWEEITTIGAGLHHEETFHDFYEKLILALSGKLDDESIQILIEKISIIISYKIDYLSKIIKIFGYLALCNTDDIPLFLGKYKKTTQERILYMKDAHGSFQGAADYHNAELTKLNHIMVNELYRIWLEAKISFVTQMPEPPLIRQDRSPHSYNEFLPRAEDLGSTWNYTEGSRKLSGLSPK